MFAGRLVPQKGIPVALRAIHLLTGQGYDVHLTSFGEGPAFYEAELHKLVRELGIEDRVTFYGECRDWQAYAQDASALIFPTQGEGTSNVILEALTVGLPVVISDIAMSRQLLRDKETALIVQSNDPKDWSSRIAEMLDSDELREGLRKEGKHLSERFSIAQMVEAYSELYDELSADVK
jgi:glycosyltransferase involved in cell wall biosynthesis